MITAKQAAKYLVSLCDDDAGDSISNLKLQKLLYYSQGVHLALHGKRLFNEPIEAWMHGPVVPSIYHELKVFGSGAVEIDEGIDLDQVGDEERETLEEVFEVFGQFSAWKLRNMTHEEPPWRDTTQGLVIPRKKLRQYFRTLLEEEEDDE